MDITGRLDHGLDCTPERCTVTLDLGIDSEIFSGEKDCTSVASDITGHNNLITRLRKGARCLKSLSQSANTGSRDKDLIDLPFAGHFGIARDEFDADFRSCLFH